jgi:hypothetical protein
LTFGSGVLARLTKKGITMTASTLTLAPAGGARGVAGSPTEDWAPLVGVPVVFRFCHHVVTDTLDYEEYTMPWPALVIDANLLMDGEADDATAASSVKLYNNGSTNAITDAIPFNTTADSIVHAISIDEAYQRVEKGNVLRALWTRSSSESNTGELHVTVLPLGR